MKTFAAMLVLCATAQVFAAELLVLNKSDATLSFVDPMNGKTLATIATGEGPHEIELSADGRQAFVSNYGAATPGNSLSVIDVRSRAETKRVDLGELRRPHGLSLHNGQLYLTAEVAKKVARFIPAAAKVDWEFDTGQQGTHMVLASRDGQRLFATNIGSDNVSLIEKQSSGEWRQTLVAVGKGPEGFDVTSDNRFLWVAHSRDGGISIIDIAQRKVVHTVDIGTKRSNRLKFTRDGRYALISDLTAGELVVVDAGARTVTARIPLGVAPTGILVPPQGNEVFVAVSGGNRIAIVDVAALKAVRSIETGKSPDGMAWVQ